MYQGPSRTVGKVNRVARLRVLITRGKRSITKDSELSKIMLLVLTLGIGLHQSKSSGGVQVLK